MSNDNALVTLEPIIESQPREIDMSDRMSILHPNLANARYELDRCLCRAIDATEAGDETKLTLTITVSAMGMMKLLDYKIGVKTTREIDGGKGNIPNMVYKYDELGRLHAFEPQVSMDDLEKREQVDVEDLTKDVAEDDAVETTDDEPGEEVQDGWTPPAEDAPAPEQEESTDAPTDEIPEEERGCDNCKSEHDDSRNGPCSTCDSSLSGWAPKADD